MARPLSSVCWAISAPAQATDLKLDLSPLKAPLEKAAAQLERAVDLAESARSDLLAALNWPLVAAAVLLTVLVMHTIHLRALAASKVNLSTEKRIP